MSRKKYDLKKSFINDKLTTAKRRQIFYDSNVRGLGIRVNPGSDTPSFVFNYLFEGCERRYTIGKWPTWTVPAARARAKELRIDVDKGIDPQGEKAARRASPTINKLLADYIERRSKLEKSKQAIRDDETNAKRITAAFGKTKADRVTLAHVKKLHRSMADVARTANKTISLLRAVYNWAPNEGGYELSGNPAKGVQLYPEDRRERYLTGKELKRVMEAIGESQTSPGLNAIKFLILTGARRGETLKATWDQINFERRTWTKPSAHTKQKKQHHVPLSAPALELLAKIKEKTRGDCIFPGNRHPDKPITDVKRVWHRIRKEAGIPDVRVHDLRHSYASTLASGGVSLQMVGALLGHTRVETTARYAHLYDDPLREATERVGALFDGLAKGENAKVVSLEQVRKRG